MGREKVQTRADPDTVEGIEQYRNEKGISNSEAVRRVLRTGLQVIDTERQEEQSDDQQNAEPQTQNKSVLSSIFSRTDETHRQVSGLALNLKETLLYLSLLYISVVVTVLAL